MRSILEKIRPIIIHIVRVYLIWKNLKKKILCEENIRKEKLKKKINKLFFIILNLFNLF